MDVKQIQGMGEALEQFLGEFDDCFVRSEPREHLHTYVAGQLSDLERKNAEAMALAAGVPPRTLQYFLSSVQWEEERMRDRVEWIVARDHADPNAIGIVDNTGNPKKGCHTAGVRRQWCGNTGKVDNCVVSVHTSYACGDFQAILDSDVFLPEEWANDPQRRQEVGIPDEVLYRKKTVIALDQIGRALANAIRVWAWTFDEDFGKDPEFLDGLDALGQSYVGEVPVNFTGWLHRPKVLLSAPAQQRRKPGQKRRFPRLARKALPACRVDNLVTHSPVFRKQKWQRFHIRDGEKGPMVWEVKYAKFYRKHGDHGLPGPTHTLIVARNVLDPTEVKYFVSNRVVGSEGVTLERLLWVAFGRWPIERCFEVAKNDLGMDHFEVRGWRAIHRHLYVTQLSHLFCARVHQQLREKNDRHSLPDGRAGSRRHKHVAGLPAVAPVGPRRVLSQLRQADRLLSTSQPAGPQVAYRKDSPTLAEARPRSSTAAVLLPR